MTCISGASISGASISDIKYVCVATEMKLYLPSLKELIPDLVILGLHTPWEGFITKYKLLTAYLSEIKDDTLICFIDAYDVLPTKQLAHLESKYRAFRETNTQAKIIVGYDKVDNSLHEFASRLIFGTVDDMRLNSGQFIGRAKDVREVIDYILKQSEFQTDQIELTKYANQFKDHVYIDVKQEFFYVKSLPLREVTVPKSVQSAAGPSTAGPAFIHANGNGFLFQFLKEEHDLLLSLPERWQHFIANLKGVIRKFIMYYVIFIRGLIPPYPRVADAVSVGWARAMGGGSKV